MKTAFTIHLSATSLLLLFTQCTVPVLKQEPENEPQKDSIHTFISPQENHQEKTDPLVESIIETAPEIIEIGKEIIEEKQRRDSIKIAERGGMFAYQLGVGFRHERLVIEAYEKLMDKDHVCVFKLGRKDYILIKYEGKNEKQLEDELASIRELYSADVTGDVKLIDLMRECGRNEKPMLTHKIKQRRKDIIIDCLTCNN